MAWSHHVDPSGRTYYYNSTTGESTYTKPPNVSSEDLTQAKDLPDGGWAEYTDPNTGRPYYVNRLTNISVWEEPEALRVRKARQEAQKMGFGTSQVVEEDPVDVYEGKDDKERIAIFQAMLLRCKISSRIKWHETMKVIGLEPEWSALPNIGKRKQAFAEYQTQRAKQEKAEARAAAKALKDNFRKMLAANETITFESKWVDVKALLKDEERFQAVKDEVDRIEYFKEFIEELDRTEREYKRKQKDAQRIAYFHVLVSHLEPKCQSTLLASNSKGLEGIAPNCAEKSLQLSGRSKFSREIEEALLLDERVSKMDHRDVRYWFEDFMELVHRAERDLERKLRDERDRRGKVLKKQFEEEVLQAQVKDGTIDRLTSWRDYLEKHQHPLLDEFKSIDALFLAREAFDNAVKQLRNDFKDADRQLQRHLDGIEPFVYLEDSRFDDFTAYLLQHNVQIPTQYPPTLQHVFESNKKRILKRQREEEAKLQSQMVDFVELLTEYFYRSDHIGIVWEEARQKLSSRSAFKRMDSDVLRQKVFEGYMAKLESKMKECIKSRDALEAQVQTLERKKKKKSKKHRRSSSSSASDRTPDRKKSKTKTEERELGEISE